MASDSATTLEDAIEAIYGLHVGITGQGAERHERPHKPLLLLAIMDLLAQGHVTPDRVVWSKELRERFTSYFQLVRRHNDQNTPENPFFYLKQEGWWQPFRQTANGIAPLKETPLVGDMPGARVWARITSPMASWLLSPAHRLQLREAIVSRYFPQAHSALSQLFQESVFQKAPHPPAEDETDSLPGRSAGFRRMILEAYDYQCAACGLRIRLPHIKDQTFVEAAHLIPFRDAKLGGNDHPTNGIALCKNHHWAMDRFLIVPAPDDSSERPRFSWRVSRLLDARRSAGEANLIRLQNQPVLQPHDEAFRPATESVLWRTQRLAS